MPFHWESFELPFRVIRGYYTREEARNHPLLRNKKTRRHFSTTEVLKLVCNLVVTCRRKEKRASLERQGKKGIVPYLFNRYLRHGDIFRHALQARVWSEGTIVCFSVHAEAVTNLRVWITERFEWICCTGISTGGKIENCGQLNYLVFI